MRASDLTVKKSQKWINTLNSSNRISSHYFFEDREIFKELSEYYNRARFRFELKTVEERDTVIQYLKERGFEPVPIVDGCDLR